MSIGSIGSSSSFDVTQMAQNFFKKADANSDGSIDKSELKTMLSNGPNGKSMSDAEVDKIFKEVDTDANGKISSSENEAQMNKMGAQGAPPSGGATGGAQASNGASTSSSNKTYDKKDANKDGTVSAQEELNYDLKHPGEVTEKDIVSLVDKLKNGTQYDQQGNANENLNGTQSLFSLSA
jgi:Ca2+-binding EF-hand superfamily protein